jgi:undecaprenyl-diphosphatase
LEIIDHNILVLLNGLVGRSPAAFEVALALCGQVPLALCVMTLLVLWWTDTERRTDATLVGDRRALERPGLLESRCRVVMIGAAITVAFAATRLIAAFTELPRPIGHETLQVPIDAARWDELVHGMTGFGAFPSDHAALYFALAVGLSAWNRTIAIVGLIVAVIFSLARVAVGFHYPGDVVVGGAIGAVAGLTARRLTPDLVPQLSTAVRLFDHFPRVMYPVLFVVALDFTQHFRMFAGVVFAVVYKVLGFAAG